MDENSDTKLRQMDRTPSHMCTPHSSEQKWDTLTTKAPDFISPESAWFIKTGCWQPSTHLAVEYHQPDKYNPTPTKVQ